MKIERVLSRSSVFRDIYPQNKEVSLFLQSLYKEKKRRLALTSFKRVLKYKNEKILRDRQVVAAIERIFCVKIRYAFIGSINV
jgi:hypothetical protein